ncbi:tetratricopeptide repeat protein [Ferrimonas balearica]|uniref:tetratricopeptide repeat protein n=1 Tax=Ferrimonas balearica TaxID=44012 RepID=UPI001F180A94|nr:tetratricopeptide repeat protein [Ferrimonas balearica]MBY6018390.1 tetratricopeptide repeat protein [Halomonas denitrificans]MBY6094742.1 tetratricopeptide repeat protein [Ferrimonas balearica]
MQDTIVNVNVSNIQALVDGSMTRPLVLNFASAQVPECQGVTAALTAEAQRRQGQFVLGNVDCDAEMDLAQYFRIQALPTVLILVKGQPVDGFAGPQPAEMISQVLQKHLPAGWELKLQEAAPLLESKAYDQALPILRDALAEEANAATRLALAEALLGLKRAEEAEGLLTEIGLADQDSRYQSLMSQLQLLKESADTPEIRALQTQLEAEPDNQGLVVELAVQLHQAGRNEEALESLYVLLKRQLDAANGEARSTFLDIVKALGAADPVAAAYRRRFYGLLY